MEDWDGVAIDGDCDRSMSGENMISPTKRGSDGTYMLIRYKAPIPQEMMFNFGW